LPQPHGDQVLREEEDHPEEPQSIVPFSGSSAPDSVRQMLYSTSQMTAPITSFDGLGYGFSGPAGTFYVNAPPDANGDVGPNHYVQVVNFGFAVFGKSGKILYGPVKLNTLFSGFGGPCEQWNNGDPVVLYDSLADRWLVSQMAGGFVPTSECIAISQTADPTGGYYRYAFQYGTAIDYPQIGIWPDAYYVTYGGPDLHCCALERAKMLTGSPASQQCLSAGQSGATPQPADLDGSRPPPAGAPNSMISYDGAKLQSFQFHVDWADPSKTVLVGPMAVAGVAPFSLSSWVAQPNTTQGLHPNTGGIRRLAYRNFGDHESLVTAHGVGAGTSSGVRWYEFRLDGKRNPVVHQQGTYAPDAAYRWLGSAAIDQAGGIALGFSLSSSSIYPSLRFTGRVATDPPGMMTLPEGKLVDGAGSQQGTNRWGDYASMSVDPADDCTFWFTSEYIDVLGNAQTRIGSFRLDGCPAAPFDFQLQAPPGTQTVALGGSTTLQIRSQVVSGTPQKLTLSASGLPPGVTALFDPLEIMAGDSAVLTLSAVASAPETASAALTVRAAAESIARAVQVQVAISSADVAVALVPASVSVGAGHSSTVEVRTSLQRGLAASVALSATGVPAGVTLSFEPPVIAAGASSVLTIAASQDAAGIATNCTVRARFGASTRESQLRIAVLATPTVTWVSPASGSTLSGTTMLVADATVVPGTTLQSVQFFVDGTSAGVVTTSPESVAWDTTLASNGPHKLSASVVDSAGNTATTAPAAVTVRNKQGGSERAQGCASTPISPFAALLSLVWLAWRRRVGSRLEKRERSHGGPSQPSRVG
jgi:hypothetical protein